MPAHETRPERAPAQANFPLREARVESASAGPSPVPEKAKRSMRAPADATIRQAAAARPTSHASALIPGPSRAQEKRARDTHREPARSARRLSTGYGAGLGEKDGLQLARGPRISLSADSKWRQVCAPSLSFRRSQATAR